MNDNNTNPKTTGKDNTIDMNETDKTNIMNDNNENSGVARNARARELAFKNLGLVRKEANRRLANSPVAGDAELREEWFKELVQEGVPGLLRAAEMFDPSRGTAFSTYALRGWVRKTVGEKFNELCDTWNHVSLDAPAGAEDSDATLGDLVADEDAETAAEAADRADRRSLVRELVALLPERERSVTTRHWGLDGLAPRTLAEIAETDGVAVQCIGRVWKRAEKRLRRLAAEAGLDPAA